MLEQNQIISLRRFELIAVSMENTIQKTDQSRNTAGGVCFHRPRYSLFLAKQEIQFLKGA